MTDENQIEDQDVELYDDENEIMEAQGHDPKNAEAQSVASVDKAGEATSTAKKRKGDNTKQDPMPKMPGTKAGMINAIYTKMAGMKKEDLAGMFGKVMSEDFDVEVSALEEASVSSNQAMHNIEDQKGRKSHADYMKKKHGVTTKYHGDDELSYHGPKANVKKALMTHYHNDKDHAKEEHPHIFKEDATAEFNYETDFSDDLNAIMANEATLSEEFKEKTAIIFEAAIKSKLAEEIDRLEEKYNEELEAEISSTKEDLVEKVDSYLNYVVEQWMDDNKLAVQTGLRTEIAEKFMSNLKDLFTESYIEVPESKVDLVDELAETVEELEEKLNAQTGKAIEMAEELEIYKREAIIAEAARGLADTQAEKLKSLVEDIDFDDEETFAKKVATVKESYFTKKASVSESADFESDDEDGETVEVSGAMAQYLNALKSTSK